MAPPIASDPAVDPPAPGRVAPVRIVCLGQTEAGDDGAGLAVFAALRRGHTPAGTEIVAIADASALIELLAGPELVVIVDAVLATPAGAVIELPPEALATAGGARVSSHGVGVAQAIELARIAAHPAPLPAIRIVAIAVDRSQLQRRGLSPAVAAAVPHVLERLAALVDRERGLSGHGASAFCPNR